MAKEVRPCASVSPPSRPSQSPPPPLLTALAARRSGSGDRGAAGVAAFEGDVLRQDRRRRRADDGKGPTGVPARGRSARDGGVGASNARPARRARPPARRAARARPGHVRLGRLVAAVPPRPGGASPAARRRRSLRRVDESRARPLPAHPSACGRRDRRPGDVDGVRARTADARPGAGDEIDRQLRRAAGRHAHRDRGEAQDDRACTRRRQQPRVREPRRRGSEAPPARSRSRPGLRSS